MIDQTNLHQILTSEMRRTILQRAVYTCPYFYRASIPVGVSVKYENVIGVNADFYLTEYQSNYSETVNSFGEYLAAIYTGYNRSVYQYVNTTKKLPSALIFGNARKAALPFGDDRQQEKLPFLIRRNDKIYVEIETITSPTLDQIEIIFKGFNVLNASQGLTPTQTDQCNASLARPIEWQFFKFQINEDVREKQYVIENDNKPRILLGFGSTNEAEQIPNITVNIVDITRRLRLTDMAVPLDFIAPRIPAVQDAHIYYLPVEYYLEPYAKLQFSVHYDQQDSFTETEVSALTRTV